MQTPPNLFKQALLEKRPQIGYWLNLPNTLVGEIAAGAGFDWLLIDGEHTRTACKASSTRPGPGRYPAAHPVSRACPWAWATWARC
jgi:4-hydroxy-2-oxoheptanedioate aldolase